MKLSDTDYSVEIREMLSRVMDDAENILWCGGPQSRSLFIAMLPMIFFCVLWLTIPSIMLVMQLQEGCPSYFAIELIMPMLFVLIGMVLFLGTYRFHKRQGKTVYVLTEKRAIVLAPKLWRGTKVNTYVVGPDMLKLIEKKKNGSGHLVFDYSDFVVNDKPMPLGFLHVQDVATPLAILKEMGVKTGQESFEF